MRHLRTNSLLGNMSYSMNLKFEKYWLIKEPDVLLSIVVVLDPMYKLKYLDFCYKKIYEPKKVAKVMN